MAASPRPRFPLTVRSVLRRARAVSGATCLALIVMATGPATAQTAEDRAEALARLQALNATVVPGSEDILCLPRDRMEADELVRLQTELLVTALACDAAEGIDSDTDLQGHYAAYRSFTGRHGDAIRAAQGEMRGYLAEAAGLADRTGREAQALFDAYQTKLANTEAEGLMDMTADRYCRIHSPRMATLFGVDAAQLEDYVAQVAGRAFYSRQSRAGC